MYQQYTEKRSVNAHRATFGGPFNQGAEAIRATMKNVTTRESVGRRAITLLGCERTH
jgi:hypothetical protein